MVYIRTDANKLVATGHIMRCITIAKKIKAFNENVIFIVKDDDTVKMIGDEFEYYCLPRNKIQIFIVRFHILEKLWQKIIMLRFYWIYIFLMLNIWS